MLFSTAWLARYVELPESTAELTELLTRCGLVVDQLDEVRGDTVLDLDVPSNRVDAMNHLGVAREVAASLGTGLKPPPFDLDEAESATIDGVAKVTVEDSEACPRFVARAVIDVTVGPSPKWMTELLGSIGLRPVNNVADITNFVLWELGHPLHAYDLDRLTGQHLIVRRARSGERMEMLDGVTRSFAAEDIIIADDERIVGLAGIMGGTDTAIQPDTTSVLLEGAWWDPPSIRRTAQRLAMHTDASHRFERAPAIDGMLEALDRAAALVAEVAGGKVCQGLIDIAAELPDPVVLGLRTERLARLLGVRIADEEIRQSLERLGFSPQPDAEGFTVDVPRNRPDVRREEDLIEEVARHHGYDRLPATLPALGAPEDPGKPEVLAERRLKELCATAGYREALSVPLSSAAEQQPFLSADETTLPIANPISATLAVLRAHLVPGLLVAIAHNLNRGQAQLRLFEVGQRFLPPVGDSGAVERTTLAMVASGPSTAHHWAENERAVDLFDLKGAMQSISRRMGWPEWHWKPGDRPGLQPGCGARLEGGDGAEGWAGRIADEVADQLGLDAPVWAVELDIESLLAMQSRTPRYRALPRFPGGVRDLSLLLAVNTSYPEIADEVESVSEQHGLPMVSLELIDVYRGEDIPDDQRSLTLRFTYRADDRTLTAAEIDAAHQRLASHLEEHFRARRR